MTSLWKRMIGAKKPVAKKTEEEKTEEEKKAEQWPTFNQDEDVWPKVALMHIRNGFSDRAAAVAPLIKNPAEHEDLLKLLAHSLLKAKMFRLLTDGLKKFITPADWQKTIKDQIDRGDCEELAELSECINLTTSDWEELLAVSISKGRLGCNDIDTIISSAGGRGIAETEYQASFGNALKIDIRQALREFFNLPPKMQSANRQIMEERIISEAAAGHDCYLACQYLEKYLSEAAGGDSGKELFTQCRQRLLDAGNYAEVFKLDKKFLKKIQPDFKLIQDQFGFVEIVSAFAESEKILRADEANRFYFDKLLPSSLIIQALDKHFAAKWQQWSDYQFTARLIGCISEDLGEKYFQLLLKRLKGQISYGNRHDIDGWSDENCCAMLLSLPQTYRQRAVEFMIRDCRRVMTYWDYLSINDIIGKYLNSQDENEQICNDEEEDDDDEEDEEE